MGYGDATLRFLSYNPLSAFGERLLDITRAKEVDVACLTGTQVKTWKAEAPCSSFAVQGSRHKAWQWGWQTGRKYSNRSCGITLLLGPRLRNHVVAVLTPPPSLSGRVAGLRVKTKTMDLLLIGVYLPCKEDGPDVRRMPCVKLVLDWLGKQVRLAPKRCIPVIMGDLNCKFGRQRTQAIPENITVGAPKFGGEETTCSRAVREWAETHDFRVETTFWDTVGPTYFSSKRSEPGTPQTTSQIDHVMLPTSAGKLVTKCCTDHRLMRRLQIIPTVRPADHCPIVFEMRAQLHHIQSRATNIDMDKVMNAVINRKERTDYVHTLEKEVGTIDPSEWNAAVEAPLPDLAWELLQKSITKATEAAFPRTVADEEKELVATRLSLLRQRRDLRQDLGAEEADLEGIRLSLVLADRRLRKLRERENKRGRPTCKNNCGRHGGSDNFQECTR